MGTDKGPTFARFVTECTWDSADVPRCSVGATEHQRFPRRGTWRPDARPLARSVSDGTSNGARERVQRKTFAFIGHSTVFAFAENRHLR
jgi:hypothetical protein